MNRQMTSLTLSLIMTFLLMGLWIMAGCEQERSPVSPDQESALAPPAGKGNPHANDNDNAELEPAGKNSDKPEPNGNATGNPHVGKNDNAKPKANGKATGNPHFNGKTENVNDGPPEHAKRKGAVKMLLLSVEDLSPVGWAMANTSGNDDVDNEVEDIDDIELIVAVDEVVGVSNGALIITVHLKDGEPDTVFDVKVIVSVDKDKTTEGDNTAHIFEDVLVTNKKGKGNAHVMIDISENGYTSPIYVGVMVGHAPGPFVIWYDTAAGENILTAVELKE